MSIKATVEINLKNSKGGKTLERNVVDINAKTITEAAKRCAAFAEKEISDTVSAYSMDNLTPKQKKRMLRQFGFAPEPTPVNVSIDGKSVRSIKLFPNKGWRAGALEAMKERFGCACSIDVKVEYQDEFGDKQIEYLNVNMGFAFNGPLDAKHYDQVLQILHTGKAGKSASDLLKEVRSLKASLRRR